MSNMRLRNARINAGMTQQELADFAGIGLSTIIRAEKGEQIRVDNIKRLSEKLGKSPDELGLLQTGEDQGVNRRDASKAILSLVTGGLVSPMGKLWPDDTVTVYANAIKTCQDLYYSGSTEHVEALLPLYVAQTDMLAVQSSPVQQKAASVASLAQQLVSELAMECENFGTAQQTAKQAFVYGQLAEDKNLQVAALICLANIGFHRKLTLEALRAYQHAVSLLDDSVTPLTQGRVYAGIAEVYAMRGDLQKSMTAMGLAYKHYPMECEKDPAYQHLRASRYSLYVFGDAQSRLFLGQYKEAGEAIARMQHECKDMDAEPITRLDMLYYQEQIAAQAGDLEGCSNLLTEGAMLAKSLGSRLYFNKLVIDLHTAQQRWPGEPILETVEEAFQW